MTIGTSRISRRLSGLRTVDEIVVNGFELKQSQSQECRTEGDDFHECNHHKIGLLVVGLNAHRQHVGLKEYDDDQRQGNLCDVERHQLFAYFLHFLFFFK